MSTYGSGAVVTPEAVRLDFQAAGVGSRTLALLIDFVILGAVAFVVLFSVSLVFATDTFGMSDTVAIIFFLIFLFLMLFGYPVAFETLWHGRTPGKAAVGLRVVTVEGAPIRFRHAAIRAALGLIDIYLLSGVAGVVAMLSTRRHQRLGDLAAGTMVLRERMASGPTHATQFHVPSGLQSFAETVDASGLTDQDYHVIRSFLLRAPSLVPDIRHDMALRLATTYAARVHVTPTVHVGPEQFLAVLAARYQQRAAAAYGRPSATHQPAGYPAAPQRDTQVASASFGPGATPQAAPHEAQPQQLGDFTQPT